MRRSRVTARLIITSAIVGLVGILAWEAADAFWVYQAGCGVRSALLAGHAVPCDAS